MHDSGVRILAGSDTPEWFNAYGFTLPRELQSYVRAGLTPYQALRTATINPAEYLQSGNEFGTIEPGKRADLVLLRANPLDDVAHLAEIDAVAIGGRWLDRAALDALRARGRTAIAGGARRRRGSARPIGASSRVIVPGPPAVEAGDLARPRRRRATVPPRLAAAPMRRLAARLALAAALLPAPLLAHPPPTAGRAPRRARYVEGFTSDTTKLARAAPRLAKYGYSRRQCGRVSRHGDVVGSRRGVRARRARGRTRTPAGAPKECDAPRRAGPTASAKVRAYWGTDYLLLAREDAAGSSRHPLQSRRPRRARGAEPPRASSADGDPRRRLVPRLPRRGARAHARVVTCIPPATSRPRRARRWTRGTSCATSPASSGGCTPRPAGRRAAIGPRPRARRGATRCSPSTTPGMPVARDLRGARPTTCRGGARRRPARDHDVEVARLMLEHEAHHRGQLYLS